MDGNLTRPNLFNVFSCPRLFQNVSGRRDMSRWVKHRPEDEEEQNWNVRITNEKAFVFLSRDVFV